MKKQSLFSDKKRQQILVVSGELSTHTWFEKENVVESMMYPGQKEVFERILNELSKLKEDKII